MKTETIYNKAKNIHDLVDRAEEVRVQIERVNEMSIHICGKLTMNAENHNGYGINTISIKNNLALIILEMTGIVLKAELQNIENSIECYLSEKQNEYKQ